MSLASLFGISIHRPGTLSFKKIISLNIAGISQSWAKFHGSQSHESFRKAVFVSFSGSALQKKWMLFCSLNLHVPCAIQLAFEIKISCYSTLVTQAKTLDNANETTPLPISVVEEKACFVLRWIKMVSLILNTSIYSLMDRYFHSLVMFNN